jgi:prophage regulatory protein
MVQKILRLRELQAATGLARSSIYAGMAAGTFPKSVPLSEKAVGWLESEIEQWQEGRIAARSARAA